MLRNTSTLRSQCVNNGTGGIWNPTNQRQVENEARTAQLPSKQGTSPEQTSVLEDSIFKISSQLSTISRNQKYFRTRENRNFSTVNSTEKRIVNFSMIQIGLIVCMGALQVFVVRFFFQVSLVCSYAGSTTLYANHLCRVRARATSKDFHGALYAWLGHYEALGGKVNGGQPDMICIIIEATLDVACGGRMMTQSSPARLARN